MVVLPFALVHIITFYYVHVVFLGVLPVATVADGNRASLLSSSSAGMRAGSTEYTSSWTTLAS